MVTPDHFNTNLLTLSLSKKELIIRVIMAYKMKLLSDLKPHVVQIGDSSGLYGVQPLLVSEHLPGTTYANLSCNARTGVVGATYLADTLVRRNPHASVLVYHATPYTLMSDEWDDELLIDSLYGEYVHPLRRILPPSHSWRLPLTNGFVTGQFVNRILPERVNTYRGRTIDQLVPDFPRLRESHGWMPRPGDRGAIPTGTIDLPLSMDQNAQTGEEQSQLEPQLELLAAYAERRQIQLVIVFNPVPEERGDGAGTEDMEAVVSNFQARHPNVYVPFPLIRTWEAEAFMDRYHLTPDASVLNSHEIGRILEPYFSSSSLGKATATPRLLRDATRPLPPAPQN